MNKQLAQLISDFQAAVGTAVSLLSESDIELPTKRSDWADADTPFEGVLKGGIEYYKHGAGCVVKLPGGGVDFDFGQRGQIDGFDEWRLWKFCQDRPGRYAFDTYQALTHCVRDAHAKGMLVAPSRDLYYVVDSDKLLGEEATRILTAGCALPHRSCDCVQTLSAQCFDSAVVMFEHFEALDRLWKKQQRLSRPNAFKFRVYLQSWLGYLYATAEGFRDLRVRLLLQNKRPAIFLELVAECDNIGKLINRYSNDLRVLRNDIFHLRTDDKAIELFFLDDGERMEWARKLHAEFFSFFKNYRMLAEVHYVISGRLGESEIRQESVERRRKRAAKTKVVR